MQVSKQRMYETIFISPPDLPEESLEKLISDVKDTFASKGAEVGRIERWGRKRMAYPVGRHNEGWFVLMHVHGPGEAVQEVERRMRINESVLKYLTVRLDDVAGAVDASRQRIERLARQEEERKQRAVERAQQQQRDEAERPERPERPSRDDERQDKPDPDEDGDDGDDR